MRLDPLIKAALDALPAAYKVIKKRDHYFVAIDGVPGRICIGGNNSRAKPGLSRITAREIANAVSPRRSPKRQSRLETV